MKEHYSGTYISDKFPQLTGKTAILMAEDFDSPTVFAQFDDIECQLAFGWTEFDRKDFTPMIAPNYSIDAHLQMREIVRTLVGKSKRRSAYIRMEEEGHGLPYGCGTKLTIQVEMLICPKGREPFHVRKKISLLNLKQEVRRFEILFRNFHD